MPQVSSAISEAKKIPYRRETPCRVLYMATTLDPTDWEGFIQKKTNQLFAAGAPDLRVISFSRPGTTNPGIWQTVPGKKDPKTGYPLFQQVSKEPAFDEAVFAKFIAENYSEGITHLAVGTHGEGTSFWFNVVKYLNGATGKDVSYKTGDFVKLLGGRQFLSVVLDCCVMAEAHSMAAFEPVAPIVTACEGWMWAPDKTTSLSLFDDTTLEQLSWNVFVQDALARNQNRYVAEGSGKADCAVIQTRFAKALVSHLDQPGPRREWMVKWAQKLNVLETVDPSKAPKICIWSQPNDGDSWDGIWLLDVGALLEQPNGNKTPQPDLSGERLFRAVSLREHGPRNGAVEIGYNVPLTGLTYSLYPYVQQKAAPKAAAAAVRGANRAAMGGKAEGPPASAGKKKSAPPKTKAAGKKVASPKKKQSASPKKKTSASPKKERSVSPKKTTAASPNKKKGKRETAPRSAGKKRQAQN